MAKFVTNREVLQPWELHKQGARVIVKHNLIGLRPQASQAPAAWKEVKDLDADGWVDASQGAVRQNDVNVRVTSVRLGRVRFKNRAVNDPLARPNRLLIELRFMHDMSQAEIARELGVSQMQVSRLLTSVLSRLRRELQLRDRS